MSEDFKVTLNERLLLETRYSPMQLGVGFVVAFVIGLLLVLNPVRYSVLVFGLMMGGIAFFRPKYGLWGMLASPAVVYFGKRLEFYVQLDPTSEFNNPVSLIPEFLIAVLMLAVLLRRSTRLRLRLHRGGLMWAVSALLILTALQIFNPSTSLKVGLFGFRTFGYYILTFFICTTLIQTERDVHYFVRITLLLTAAVAAYGIFQQVVGIPIWDRVWFLEFFYNQTTSWLAGYHFSWEELRKFSTMQHPPAAANLYLVAMLLGVPHLSRSRTNLWLIVLLALPVIGLALFFTYVRGSWVGILGGLITMAIIWKVPNSRRHGYGLVIFYYIVVLVSLVVLSRLVPEVVHYSPMDQLSPGVKQRVISLTDPMNSPEMQVRFTRWQRTLTLIRETPLGSGIGMTGGVAQRFGGFGVVDNLYLKMLLELGWISIIIFGVILYLSARIAWRLYRTVPESLIADFGLSTLGILTAVSLEGIVQPTLEMSISAIYFWSVLGILNSLDDAVRIK